MYRQTEQQISPLAKRLMLLGSPPDILHDAKPKRAHLSAHLGAQVLGNNKLRIKKYPTRLFYH